MEGAASSLAPRYDSRSSPTHPTALVVLAPVGSRLVRNSCSEQGGPHPTAVSAREVGPKGSSWTGKYGWWVQTHRSGRGHPHAKAVGGAADLRDQLAIWRSTAFPRAWRCAAVPHDPSQWLRRVSRAERVQSVAAAAAAAAALPERPATRAAGEYTMYCARRTSLAPPRLYRFRTLDLLTLSMCPWCPLFSAGAHMSVFMVLLAPLEARHSSTLAT